MRNFLVRLAQRSIGQVPVVRSRAMVAPPVIGAGVGPAMAEAPEPSRAPAVAVGEPSPLVAAVTHSAGEPPSAIPPAGMPSIVIPPAEIHAIHTTRVITEVVERPSSASSIASSERDGQEVAPLVATTDQPPRVAPPIRPVLAVAIEPAAPPPTMADPAPQVPTEASALARDDIIPAIDRGPALRPAPIEIVAPRLEPLDATEPIRHAAALTPASRDLPPQFSLGAVPPAPTAAKASPPSEERVVQVRIGAIEIHAPMPPPAPPAPAAVPLPRAVPRGGFDDFARLRSYAPWEW